MKVKKREEVKKQAEQLQKEGKAEEAMAVMFGAVTEAATAMPKDRKGK